MATFKHISSKNADYGAAEQYLTFEYDEFTMKPTLDKNGQIIPRTGYLISSLNCGDEDFAIACMRSNLKYGKNQKREDVKSHHYIISFDPRDAADNGLIVDQAQQLGEQFCKEHFPGHQALVCTHPDGHNHSGNIHVHIVINSLRIAEVMEMCHRENLYQIDLLHGSKNRVTEREYWAKRKGQAALDKENASLVATGEPPKLTKFETDKEKLRHTIRIDLLTEGVTENLRKVTSYAAKHEARFMKLLTEQTEDGSKRRNAAKKKELEAAEKRIAELSAIFKRLYEDSVAGRISDERFTELSADYEAEQKELKERAAVLQGELSRTLEATANAEKFMKVVRKYTSFEELTPTLLREFVEKIVIHESEALDGKRRGKLRRQEIEIYYSFVGKVELPD